MSGDTDPATSVPGQILYGQHGSRDYPIQTPGRLLGEVHSAGNGVNFHQARGKDWREPGNEFSMTEEILRSVPSARPVVLVHSPHDRCETEGHRWFDNRHHSRRSSSGLEAVRSSGCDQGNNCVLKEAGINCPRRIHFTRKSGNSEQFDQKHLKNVRPSTVLFHLTHWLLCEKWRDPGEEPKLHLFGQLKQITKKWLDNYLVCKGKPHSLVSIDVECCGSCRPAVRRPVMIERTWQDLHANVTRNHTRPGMDELMDDVRDYLNNRNRQKNNIKSQRDHCPRIRLGD